jgi:hypothetical protein
VELKRRAAVFISAGLVAATGSIALTSVVGFSYSSSPAMARLVTQSLVKRASRSSTQPMVGITAGQSVASASPALHAR